MHTYTGENYLKAIYKLSEHSEKEDCNCRRPWVSFRFFQAFDEKFFSSLSGRLSKP